MSWELHQLDKYSNVLEHTDITIFGFSSFVISHNVLVLSACNGVVFFSSRYSLDSDKSHKTYNKQIKEVKMVALIIIGGAVLVLVVGMFLMRKGMDK